MFGFSRGRELEKIGIRLPDAVELSRDNVSVPVANQLG